MNKDKIMAVNFGSNTDLKFRYGTNQVKKIMHGNSLVWPPVNKKFTIRVQTTANNELVVLPLTWDATSNPSGVKIDWGNTNKTTITTSAQMTTDARQTYATAGTYDISIISNNPENEHFIWTSDPAPLSGWDDTMRSKFKDIINCCNW
jgi:hypothetical protein